MGTAVIPNFLPYGFLLATVTTNDATLIMIYVMPICLLIAHLSYLSHARSFIPDEHMVWCPEQLLQCMLAHIHYMPDHWRGNANKSETRDEVAQLFQYKAVRRGNIFIDRNPFFHS